MNRRKTTYFRNSLDLRDKVQVKVLRKRLKVSDEQFAGIVRKSGNSMSAITLPMTSTATPVSAAAKQQHQNSYNKDQFHRKSPSLNALRISRA